MVISVLVVFEKIKTTQKCKLLSFVIVVCMPSSLHIYPSKTPFDTLHYTCTYTVIQNCIMLQRVMWYCCLKRTVINPSVIVVTNHLMRIDILLIFSRYGARSRIIYYNIIHSCTVRFSRKEISLQRARTIRIIIIIIKIIIYYTSFK